MVIIVSSHPNVINFGTFETLDLAKQTLEVYESDGLLCRDGELLFHAYGSLLPLATFENYIITYNENNLRLYYDVFENNH